jgi:hypothetical protein
MMCDVHSMAVIIITIIIIIIIFFTFWFNRPLAFESVRMPKQCYIILTLFWIQHFYIVLIDSVQEQMKCRLL